MKKLKFIKENLINQIFRLRYLSYAKKIHKKNTTEHKLITIEKLDKHTAKNLNNILRKMCKDYIKFENNILYFMPISVIDIKKGYDLYIKSLSSNSRSKIKRAKKKGVDCKIFNWNHYLDDIYEIHTSSYIRQGKEMNREYLAYPKKVEIINNENFKNIYIGAFIEDKLVGYIELYIYKNFAMTNRLLGHKNFLNKYIMNALFSYTVEYLEINDIEYLNYLTMHNIEKKTLSQFKKRIGFSEFSLIKIEQ